jgi:hypothetical protein
MGIQIPLFQSYDYGYYHYHEFYSWLFRFRSFRAMIKNGFLKPQLQINKEFPTRSGLITVIIRSIIRLCKTKIVLIKQVLGIQADLALHSANVELVR